MNKNFTTVTRFSKAVALLLFILLPAVTFILGMEYEKSLENIPTGVLKVDTGTKVVVPLKK